MVVVVVRGGGGEHLYAKSVTLNSISQTTSSKAIWPKSARAGAP